MSDDKSQTGSPEEGRIDIRQIHEIDYWSTKLGVSRDILIDALRKVGPVVADVKRHLQK